MVFSGMSIGIVWDPVSMGKEAADKALIFLASVYSKPAVTHHQVIALTVACLPSYLAVIISSLHNISSYLLIIIIKKKRDN